MNRIKILFAFIAMVSLYSCEREVDERESDEMLRFQAYMSIHYPQLEPTSSGLYYIINEPGAGDLPVEGNYILYHYEGKNLDGDIFETTNSTNAQLHDIFSKSTRYVPRFTKFKSATSFMISGLVEGISMLKQGGNGTFIMPSRLAYGNQSYKNLPTFSSVIYNITLQRIVTDPDAYEQEIIDEYLLANYPSLIVDSIYRDSIYMLDSIQGVGDIYLDDQTVDSVNYIGRFTDGWVFDTNIDSVARLHNLYNSEKVYEPISIKIGSSEYIEGFSTVLKKLRRESYAKVIIPSAQAYGAVGSQSIFPYTPLVFEIWVVTKAPVEEEEEEK
jgi:FKBP-type peptidyl-prolyl cis-trans isomerase